MSVLEQDFFARPAAHVAPDLLGAMLVRERNGNEERYMITETEAYCGEEDLACHASKGRTKRTEVMYGAPGHWYVYLIYGMYDMLNVVTAEEGVPEAVLIRGVEGHDGPGKLTKALGITKHEFNTTKAEKPTGLWIEPASRATERKIARTPRIGVDYAGKWAEKPLRFLLEKPERNF